MGDAGGSRWVVTGVVLSGAHSEHCLLSAWSAMDFPPLWAWHPSSSAVAALGLDTSTAGGEMAGPERVWRALR